MANKPTLPHLIHMQQQTENKNINHSINKPVIEEKYPEITDQPGTKNNMYNHFKHIFYQLIT